MIKLQIVDAKGMTLINQEMLFKQIISDIGKSSKSIELRNFKIDLANIWSTNLSLVFNLVGCRFKNCYLSGANFSDYNITGCIFKDCILPNMNATNVRFTGSKFINCNMFNSKLIGCTFNKTVFSTCNMDVSRIDSEFTDAILSHVFLRESDITGSTFKRAKLYDIKFDDTILNGVDFRSAEFKYMKVNRR